MGRGAAGGGFWLRSREISEVTLNPRKRRWRPKLRERDGRARTISRPIRRLVHAAGDGALEFPDDEALVRDAADEIVRNRLAMRGLAAPSSDQPSTFSELRRLVIAARVVAFQDQGHEALKELDEASEAFADLIPWEDEPATLTRGDDHASHYRQEVDRVNRSTEREMDEAERARRAALKEAKP